MAHREVAAGVFVPWFGERIDGVSYSRDIEEVWSAAELAAINLYVPAPAEPVPEGKRSTGLSVQRVEGVVRFVHDLEDIPPPTTLELVDYARQKRWEKEVGGIVVAGVAVATDDRSQTKIIGARVAADADPNWSTVWSGADGNLYPVNAAAMVAISNAVQAHVNACFTVYATVIEGVNNETITTYAEVDAEFS